MSPKREFLPECARRTFATLAVGWWLVGSATAAEPPVRRVDIIRDVPAAGDLAAPANGQTLYVLDESSGGVIAIDPFEPTNRWLAVAAPEKDASPASRAIGSIDTGTLAILCQSRQGWSIRTHRVQPGVTAKPEDAVQTVATAAAPDGGGKAAAPAEPSRDRRPGIAVSPSRDWLAVTGIDLPATPVVRAPIAGARLGTFSTRSCPHLEAETRPVALAISADDEFVLFANERGPGDAARIFISFYRPPDPRRLLHVDSGLPRINDAAYCRADGTLWVVGGATGSPELPEGLWRIDAVLRRGRQEAQATCVARLEGAVSLACLSKGAIVVTHGRTTRMVSLIDPTRDQPDRDPSRRSGEPAGAAP